MIQSQRNTDGRAAWGAGVDLEASFPRIGLNTIFQAIMIVFMAQLLSMWRLIALAAETGRLFHLVSAHEVALFEALLGAMVGAGLAWFFVSVRAGAPARTGLALRRPQIAYVAAGLALGLAIGAVWAEFLAGRGLARMRVQGGLGYGLWLGYVALGPMGEELYYRGLILPALMRRLSPNTGLAVMTVGRALLMAAGAPDSDMMWPQFGISFTMELGLGLLRLFSRSLWPGVAANYAMTVVFWVLLARFA